MISNIILVIVSYRVGYWCYQGSYYGIIVVSDFVCFGFGVGVGFVDDKMMKTAVTVVNYIDTMEMIGEEQVDSVLMIV